MTGLLSHRVVAGFLCVSLKRNYWPAIEIVGGRK